MPIAPLRSLLTASLIAALVAVPGSARSQPVSSNSAAATASVAAPSDASTAPAVRLLEVPVEASLDEAGIRADELTGKANGLLFARRSVEAEELYQQAWALKHSYDIAGNLGVAEVETGKHREAVEHLVFALRHFPFSAEQEPRARLRELIATERMHVVMLLVVVNLAGAEVFVDENSVGVAPLRDEMFVEAGPRHIEARQKGYVTADASITGEIGTAWRVSLTLEPEPPPRPAHRIPEAPLPPEAGDDWLIRLAVVSALMTIALFVVARKGLPWFTRVRVRLSRRWQRLHPGRRRLVARAHRRH